jgi:hypothetical protein
MEAISYLSAAFRSSPFYFSATLLLPLLLPVLARHYFGRGGDGSKPWSLPSWKGIPFLGNTIQYIVDNESFISRASLALQTRDIVQFYLGPTKAYLIVGAQNVQALFRTSKSPSVGSEIFNIMTMDSLMCYTKEDVAKYANDKTGRLAEPKEGTMAAHQGRRYWYEMHHQMKNLSQISSTSRLTEKFLEFFSDRVQEYPLGEPVKVNLYHFMRTKMAGAAIRALVGHRLLDRIGEEEMIDAFWGYDSVVINLLYALPKWLAPKPWQVRGRAQAMCLDWLRNEFDPVSDLGKEEDNVDWHPVLGLRFLREYLQWNKRTGHSDETRAGQLLGFLLGWVAVMEFQEETSRFTGWLTSVPGSTQTPSPSPRGL